MLLNTKFLLIVNMRMDTSVFEISETKLLGHVNVYFYCVFNKFHLFLNRIKSIAEDGI